MSSHDAVAQRRTTSTSFEHRLDALGAEIAGAVLAPQDASWDVERRPWALSVDQRPAAVALPESADDVAAIVTFAAERGLRVAPQGTGHNAHPLEHRLGDTILLKTSRMRSVEIDPLRRRARIEAGALWMDVTVPAGDHGLAALAGSSPDVGVVGYTLAGGLSWLSRRHGLAANHVTAIELVTADGTQVRTDPDHEPDLFWALRGGGGSFGVVTAIEIDLLPIAQVYAGAMFWPQERACEVLLAWREWAEQALPDEIISVGRIVNVPPFPEIPAPLRGRSFVLVEAVYLGDERDGAELLAPLRALAPEIDTLATMPATALGHLHMDPPGPVAGKGDGLLLGDLPAESVEAFVDAATGESGAALLSAEIRQLGGAIARPAPNHGAVGSIDAPYITYVVGATPTAELRDIVQAQVNGVQRALSPWSASHQYMNFTERPVDSRMLYGSEFTHRRLRSIKAKYDPADVIQSNHPIRPAA